MYNVGKDRCLECSIGSLWSYFEGSDTECIEKEGMFQAGMPRRHFFGAILKQQQQQQGQRYVLQVNYVNPSSPLLNCLLIRAKLTQACTRSLEPLPPFGGSLCLVFSSELALNFRNGSALPGATYTRLSDTETGSFDYVDHENHSTTAWWIYVVYLEDISPAQQQQHQQQRRLTIYNFCSAL
jgi:hypothetical protein